MCCDALLQEDEQHFVQAVQVGGRDRRDFEECVSRGPIDQRHVANGIAGRKRAAQPGGDQQIADLDVGIAGQERQGQSLEVSGTHRNTPQAVADDLDGQCVVGVRDQEGYRAVLLVPRNLTNDSSCIDEGLALISSVPAAFVQNYPVPERIHVHGQDFADHHPIGHPGLGIEQSPEARVFRPQRCQTLQLDAGGQRLAAQQGIFRNQLPSERQVFAHPAHPGSRRIDRDLQRVEGFAQVGPDFLEVGTAMIHEHERKREGRRQKEAEPRADVPVGPTLAIR